MAEEPKDHPEDIESILSDLDAILSDMGGDAQAAPQPEPPKAPSKIDVPAPAPEPVKAAAPKPAEPPKPAAPPPPPPPAPAPKAEMPKPAIEMPKPASIELSPREGIIKPPEKKPEPPKPAPKLPEQRSIELSAGPEIPDTPKPIPPPPAPKAVEPPKPVEAPKPIAPPDSPKAPPAPTAVPVPVPVVASTTIEELPADTPKEQIRRVAYVYTAACSEVRTACAAFLSQAARTISKKPLFLREVLSHEVGPASDPNAVVQKALQVKAAAILAVVEGWPQAKVDELSEACSRANLLFRSVAPADAQKKSTAVDIIVDMMLLPGEG
jgi:hypothetical protein